MSFIPLQIADLETRLAQATNELNRAGTDGRPGVGKRGSKDWLPSADPQHSLVGHRDKVYAVRFHPHYTVLASASGDATVKIWDWEAGELERTLKAHTRAVTDCDFDGSGRILGKRSGYVLRLWVLWRVGHRSHNLSTPMCSDRIQRLAHQTVECVRGVQQLRHSTWA